MRCGEKGREEREGVVVMVVCVERREGGRRKGELVAALASYRCKGNEAQRERPQKSTLPDTLEPL